MSPVLLAATDTGGGEAVLFWILGPIMVIASLGLVFARKAVHAALSMAVVMVGLGACTSPSRRRSSAPCRSSSTPAR